MKQRRRIYEGKAKILYEGPEPGTLVQHFKDDATAFNAQKHDVIEGKGVLNNRISEHIFSALAQVVDRLIVLEQGVVMVKDLAKGEQRALPIDTVVDVIVTESSESAG